MEFMQKGLWQDCNRRISNIMRILANSPLTSHTGLRYIPPLWNWGRKLTETKVFASQLGHIDLYEGVWRVTCNKHVGCFCPVIAFPVSWYWGRKIRFYWLLLGSVVSMSTGLEKIFSVRISLFGSSCLMRFHFTIEVLQNVRYYSCHQLAIY